MNKHIISTSVALFAMIFLSGCVIDIGDIGDTKGQQLIDLQKAKDAGAITNAEFQTQKAKLLEKE